MTAGTRLKPVLAILLVTVLAALAWTRRDLRPGSHAPGGARASLAIEPFKVTDTQSFAWNSAAFADSLATRLAGVEGLNAKVVASGRTNAEFTLSGDVGLTDGRLVVSTRLLHSAERLPVWSGTFWRSRNTLDNFVDDVAAGVVEALYADIARRALTTTKERS